MAPVPIEDEVRKPSKIRGMEVVIRPDERDETLARMSGLLDKGWLIWGDQQEEFQARWEKLTGRAHARTFCSATLALEVSFRFLKDTGLKGVAMFANNFPSPGMAARRAGLSVSYVDINPTTITPDVEDLESAFKAEPFQILAVTWTGGFVPSNVIAVQKWAGEHGIVIVEDASHAAGSYAHGAPAGSFGDIAVFSLAATKALHTGQGGILLTDSAELAQIAFRSKNYGRTELFQKGEYVLEGWNAQMTEMQAALGNVLFESMPARVQERTHWAAQYDTYCRRVGSLTPVGDRADKGVAPNFYKYPVLLPEGTDRAAFAAFMAERQIELGSSIYEFVTPALKVWGEDARPAEAFPKTLEFAKRHVCLPLHNALTADDVQRVGAAILEFFLAR